MKYNIAISGTFDVENYGDLLFPVIFEKAMRKRGLDFNYFVFSPLAKGGKKALDSDCTVYPIEKIDDINKINPLNAIVVGGGALLQFADIAVKMPSCEDFTKYRITDSWLVPSYFGFKNNIKVLYNLPQIPYKINNAFADTMKNLFDRLDYISFRDENSYNNFTEIYDKDAPEANVYPDSVCSISEFFSPDYLNEIRKNELGFTDQPYAVLHFNPQKPEKDNEFIDRTVNILTKRGIKVVLLPLGYTHGDDVAMKQFCKTNQLCTFLDKKLNIIQMASVLAGCELYIGTSFHGAVTALSYERKAISYNYILPYKNMEIFKMFGIEEYVLSGAENMPDLTQYLLDHTQITKIEQVKKQVNQHFDALYNSIISDKKSNFPKPPDSEKILSDLVADSASVFSEFELLQKQRKELEDNYSSLKNTYENEVKKAGILQENYSQLKDFYDNLEINYNALSKDYDFITARYEETLSQKDYFELQYNQISNSNWWKVTLPARIVLTKIKNIFK